MARRQPQPCRTSRFRKRWMERLSSGWNRSATNTTGRDAFPGSQRSNLHRLRSDGIQGQRHLQVAIELGEGIEIDASVHAALFVVDRHACADRCGGVMPNLRYKTDGNTDAT